MSIQGFGNLTSSLMARLTLYNLRSPATLSICCRASIATEINAAVLIQRIYYCLGSGGDCFNATDLKFGNHPLVRFYHSCNLFLYTLIHQDFLSRNPLLGWGIAYHLIWERRLVEKREQSKDFIFSIVPVELLPSTSGARRILPP